MFLTYMFLRTCAGFCVDSTGACTVPKEYDESQKIFFCPGTPREAPAVSTASVKNPAKVAVDPSCGESVFRLCKGATVIGGCCFCCPAVSISVFHCIPVKFPGMHA